LRLRGPRGELTRMDYGARYSYSQAVQALYTYSPETLRLTGLQTLGLSLSYNCVHFTPGTYEYGSRIYDIVNNYDETHLSDQHYEYDHLRRLTSYWQANGRLTGQPVKKIDWTYDRYGNMLTKTTHDQGLPPEGCVETYTVDAATNRVTAYGNSCTTWPPPPQETYSYDAVGNRLGDGKSYDAENRLKGWTGTGFLYDGNSRRFRKLVGSTKVFYVYSALGMMLVEDDWTAGTTQNQIYFNGQLIATHDQDEYVRFLFKDHLGSTRSVATVTPQEPGYTWGYDWETTAVFAYNPFGDYSSSSIQDPQVTKMRFTGKEREKEAWTPIIHYFPNPCLSLPGASGAWGLRK
jgi:hypothetical protein